MGRVSQGLMKERTNISSVELKKGFKFEDNGHPNQQITWLVEGE